MGKYTLDYDDSDNIEGFQDANQWDEDGDVVMQDAQHFDEPDEKYNQDAIHTVHDDQSSPRQPQSLWSRALAIKVSDDEEDEQERGEKSSATEAGGPSYSYQVVGRAENGDLIQFHYHVCSNPPSFPTSNQKQSIFTSCGWMFISLMAVLAHICYWYGPSVPPPPDSHATTVTTNWQEFLSQEAAVALELIVRWGAIAQYVGYWCFEAMSRESIHVFQSLKSNTHPTTANAMPKVVSDCHAPWQWDTSHLKIVGQDEALDKLGKILNAEWNFHRNDEPTQPHRATMDPKPQRRNPLLFYVIGGPSVGKELLAPSLARQFHGKDCFHSSVLLELDANGKAKHAGQTIGSSGTETPPHELVWNHAMDHPNGSIVLWPLDETDQSKSQVLAFLQDLYKTQSPGSGTLDKMIIVMTSEIGNPTIHRVLRKYGRTDLPLLELESFLRYELTEAYDKKTHGNSQSTEGNDSSLVTSQSSIVQEATANLFFKVHILTMLPLDREAMRTILFQRLQTEYTGNDHSTQNSHKFHVPDNALKYLLDHGLNWNQWIHAKTGQLMLEYCADGARAIDPLLLRISSSCSLELPHQQDKSTTTTLLLLDKDMGKFEMATCPTDSDTLDGCNFDCQFVL